MAETKAAVVLRMGSHSEKEYIEKTIKYFDGLMVGANLVEATPGATASLLVRLQSFGQRPYFIDPMTYAFGAYVDPDTDIVRKDLDWIKSDQKVKGGKKGETKRDFKSSYRALAQEFGPPFSDALEKGIALGPSDFETSKKVDDLCSRILQYQSTRVRNVFSEDEEARAFLPEIPCPSALLAPYFYIEMSQANEWVDLNGRMLASSVAQAKDVQVHGVVCCHRGMLVNKTLAAKVIEQIENAKPAGVWLWFSRFNEHTASLTELLALREWVERLSPTVPVYNMHGGYYSLLLSKFGMSSVAHGVGYGEQKDVVPIIGQSTPTIQYYVRALHAKYSVALITRSFTALGIKTAADFYAKICDCTICKGIIGDKLEHFAQFGEMGKSTPKSKRAAQTPAAAKRCRFHFLLNRLKERQLVNSSTLFALKQELSNENGVWSKTVLGRSHEHLPNWIKALDVVESGTAEKG